MVAVLVDLWSIGVSQVNSRSKEQSKMTPSQQLKKYHDTINSLFNLLAIANAAETNVAYTWQTPSDAGSRSYYGSIRKAITDIAGEEIVAHWTECGEIDFTLASRNLFTLGYREGDEVPAEIIALVQGEVRQGLQDCDCGNIVDNCECVLFDDDPFDCPDY